MGSQEKTKKKARNRIQGNDFEMFGVNPLKHGGVDLMQNCDLPPPSKVFRGGSGKTVMFSMNRVCNNGIESVGKEQDSDNCKNGFEFFNWVNEGKIDNDKVELLKALRSSQTRAREAEKKAAILGKEKECLSDVLLRDAMQLFGYRQQLRLLQLQVSNLESLCLRQQQQPRLSCCDLDEPKGAVGSLEEDDDDDGQMTGVAWILTLALSWGIGVGTALACRYLLH
ncbi:hypothetical protein L6164_012415 [Bauhinia variegata]|uniref:Uncharacterized protein n=1 Tax=Bauhinia variegata TaxID=167791 RepID=A0ACB9P9G9_BAUVA|nr:hypothetical protein L6164_012415 [Bauhinia variegata]